MMDWLEASRYAGNHTCAVCGRIPGKFPLPNFQDEHGMWQDGGYEVRCADKSHQGLTEIPSYTQRYKRGQEVPLYIAKWIEKKLGGKYMESKSLIKLSPERMLERVNRARFPTDLTPSDRQVIATVSLEYGLDPLFGELMIYQGRPYVVLEARRRKAQETGTLDGINSRPASEEERKARQVESGDYLYMCEVWVKGASHPFEGWGRVTKKEIDQMVTAAKGHTRDPYALPLVKNPGGMAEKRAEAQALKRAFHIPLPSFEDIMGVVEGEYRELSEDKPPEPKPRQPASPQPATEGSITQNQLGKIWGTAKQMGYTQEKVDRLTLQHFGVDSVGKLSKEQASSLIQMIERGDGLPPLGEEAKGG